MRQTPGNKIITGLALAALTLAAGCISTRASLAPNTNVARFRTFAFAPENSAVARTPTGAIVRDTLARELAGKGIYPAPPGQRPDFYVGYQLVLREQLDVYGGGWGGGWGWGGWGWGGPVDVFQYTEGTLVLDFIDPRTNHSFWRGTATSVINTPDNPKPEKIRKSVAKTLEKYPVQLTASAPGPTRM
jgi:hypothetical protein